MVCIWRLVDTLLAVAQAVWSMPGRAPGDALVGSVIGIRSVACTRCAIAILVWGLGCRTSGHARLSVVVGIWLGPITSSALPEIVRGVASWAG